MQALCNEASGLKAPGLKVPTDGGDVFRVDLSHVGAGVGGIVVSVDTAVDVWNRGDVGRGWRSRAGLVELVRGDPHQADDVAVVGVVQGDHFVRISACSTKCLYLLDIHSDKQVKYLESFSST